MVIQTTVTEPTKLTGANFNQVIVCAGSSNFPVELPESTAGNKGESLIVRMSPALAAMVTLKPAVGSGQTIAGATERIMWASESATLVSNGSGYDIIASTDRALVCEMRGVYPGGTLLASTEFGTHLGLNQVDVDSTSGFASPMSDTENGRIVIRRGGKYVVTTGICFKATNINVERLLVWASTWVAGGTEGQPSFAEAEASVAKEAGGVAAQFPTFGKSQLVSLNTGEAVRLWADVIGVGSLEVLATSTGVAPILSVQEIR